MISVYGLLEKLKFVLFAEPLGAADGCGRPFLPVAYPATAAMLARFTGLFVPSN
jgi:hypothetical protein